MDDNPYSVGEQLSFDDTNLQGPEFEGAVRGMQTISIALMIGVLIYLGIVMRTIGGQLLGRPNLLTIIGVVFACLMVVVHFIVPGIMCKRQLKEAVASGVMQKSEQEQVGHVIGVFRGQMIVGLALLEGAAFINLTAMMIDHSEISIFVIVLLMGLMLFRFPTRDKVSYWVQDKLRELCL